MLTPSLLELLKERAANKYCPGDDDYHLALSVEGGGMRGAISAGMLEAIKQLELTGLFDSLWGTSIGAISCAYLAAGTDIHAADNFVKAALEPQFLQLKINRPILNLDWFMDYLLDEYNCLDYQAIIDNPLKIHPMLYKPTWETARPADQVLDLNKIDNLRLALRSAISVPGMAGWPVGKGCDWFWDAGVIEAIPWQSALRHGATHVLILRTMPCYASGFGSYGLAGYALARMIAHGQATPYGVQAKATEIACYNKNIKQIAPRPNQIISAGCRNISMIRKAACDGERLCNKWFESALI